jgi:hypothetical protein
MEREGERGKEEVENFAVDSQSDVLRMKRSHVSP